MSTNYQKSSVIGCDLDHTSTTATHALGTIVQGTNGGAFMYVLASGAITQYDYVTINSSFAAVSGTKTEADKGMRVGFAQVAFADTEYGWVALHGEGIKVRLGASCLPNVSLYTSGTAGVLDDSSTSQTKITGVTAVSTNGGTVAAVAIRANWPHV